MNARRGARATTDLPLVPARRTLGRAGRRAMRGALAIVVAGLILIAAGASAEPADTTGSVAVLERAPESRLGIDSLGPNVLPCLVATYSFAGATVQVTYTDAAIPPFASWPSAPCASPGVKSVPASSSDGGSEAIPPVLSYADSGGWHLFFAFPSGFQDVGACLFVSRFVPRFEYFLSATGGDPRSSFPAVLQP